MAHARSTHHLGWTATAAIAALFQTACLSPTFEVPRDEVERLLSVAPEKRGERIHAVQRFSIAQDLTPAPPWGQPGGVAGDGAPVGAVPAPGMSPLYHAWHPNPYGWGQPYYGPTLWTSGGSSGATVRGGGAPVSGGITPASGSPLGPSIGKAGRDDWRATATIIVVSAIVLAAVLAASEGARYDGAVAVHPHHPVHLLGAGPERIVALDELTPSDLDSADSFVLAGHEGAGLWLRGRAPLNRSGLAFTVGGGVQGLQLRQDALVSGGLFETSLGAHPSGWVGVHGRFQFIDGTAVGGDFVGVGALAEVQAMPLAVGPFHLGAYGGGGYQWVRSGGGQLPFTDADRLAVLAGVQGEIEWTTRLAVYLRYGVTAAVAGDDTGAWLTGLSLGLSIY
ncbi:MAG: hypothetical protein FJ102_27240 [Deltaproteobacteria bacterium]|nr:hypothetical protein [Deltaproteobacteria bacterium]